MQRDARAGLVGATFGLVFVLVNAGDLGASYRLPVRGLGVAVFLVVLGMLLRSRGGGEEARVEPSAWRLYWIAVAAEAVALFAGATVLSRTGHQDFSLPWVVFVVGVHFVPLAYAFRQPFYELLGGVLVVLGATGAVLAYLDARTAAVAFVSGVLAGLTLMFFAARPALVGTGPADEAVQ